MNSTAGYTKVRLEEEFLFLGFQQGKWAKPVKMTP